MRMFVTLAAGLAFAPIPLAAQTPTPAAPAAAAPAAADPAQEIICRKERETGSLVKSKKTCHTRAQWAYIDDTNQAFSRDLVDQTRTRPGGN